jgi:hypothetical protein
MTAREMVSIIQAAGGTITLQPDSFEVWLPPEFTHLLPQIEAKKESVRAVIEGQQAVPYKSLRPAKTPKSSRRSALATATRKLKKFLRDAQAAGVVFRRSGVFFEVELPDGLRVEDYEPTIRANAEKIFAMLWPAPPSFRRRPRCEICPPKTGCRTVGATVDNEQICPLCGCACRSHYKAQHFGDLLNLPTKYDFPGGCNKCNKCPGFPVAPRPVKAKKTKAKVTAVQLPLPVTNDQPTGDLNL